MWLWSLGRGWLLVSSLVAHAFPERAAGLLPSEGRASGQLANGTNRPPTLAVPGPYHVSCQGVSAGPCLLLCFPEGSAAEETLPGPSKQPQPHKGICSGKNKAPSLGAHPASPRCTWAAPTGRERQPTTAQRCEGTCCPEVTWLGRPGIKRKSSHSRLQIPVHLHKSEVYDSAVPFFSGPCSNR